MQKNKQYKNEKREIRSLIMGKTLLTDEGMLQAKDPGMILVSQGVVDGAGAVCFLGIKEIRFLYETDLEERALLENARKAMRKMGRAVSLREQPEVPACLIRYVLTGPAVLIFRDRQGKLELTAWSARGLMGFLARRRAVSAFERALGESIRPAQLKEGPGGKTGKRSPKRQRSQTGNEEKASVEEPADDPDTAKQEDTGEEV